jgi:hypothetical protein
MAGLDARKRERVAAGMLPEGQRHRCAEVARIDHLICPGVLEHPVLVDPGLARERVRADDRLVRADRVAGEKADERRGLADHAEVDGRLEVEDVGSHAQRNHDLFERCVSGPLADPVDRALDLVRTRGGARQGVRDRQPEVVVAMGRDLDLRQFGTALEHFGEEVGVLARGRVADGVRQVHGRRAGRDDGVDHVDEEGSIRAGRILGRELDLVDALRRVGDRPAGRLQHLVGRQAELALHVQRAGREHDVDSTARRAGERCCGGVDVLGDRARERANGGAGNGVRHRSDTGEVARRGRGEACLDHVDAQPLEGQRDLDLLARAQRDARRLLAVSQGGVEDPDPAHSFTPRSAP